MQPVTMSEIATCLAPHAALYGVVVDEALCAAWKVALVDALAADGIRPVTASELRAATLRHTYRSRFKMTPGDAWEAVKANRAMKGRAIERGQS